MSEKPANFAQSSGAKLGHGMRTDELHQYLTDKMLDAEQMSELAYHHQLNTSYYE